MGLYETAGLGLADKVKKEQRSFYESYNVFCKVCTELRFSLPLKPSNAYKGEGSITGL